MMNRTELAMDQMAAVVGGENTEELNLEINYELFFDLYSNLYGAETVEALRKEFGDEEAFNILEGRQRAPFYKRIYPGMEAC